MAVDHIAFPTRSIGATHDFYTRVMGWPMVVGWGREDAEHPFFIIGFDTGSFVLEFEEEVGVDRPKAALTDVFPHIGVEIEDVAPWKERFDELGVPSLELGHDLWVTDPNGVKLQLFVRTDHGTPEERLAKSEQNLAAWLAR